MRIIDTSNFTFYRLQKNILTNQNEKFKSIITFWQFSHVQIVIFFQDEIPDHFGIPILNVPKLLLQNLHSEDPLLSVLWALSTMIQCLICQQPIRLPLQVELRKKKEKVIKRCREDQIVSKYVVLIKLITKAILKRFI